MNITKDEARIISIALADYKYSVAEKAPTRELANKVVTAFTRFEQKLDEFSRDERRNGRKSRNDYADCISRFVNCH